ncbi:MAG: hypothetical protein V4532_14430 [Pseudomonadota bacterium]
MQTVVRWLPEDGQIMKYSFQSIRGAWRGLALLAALASGLMAGCAAGPSASASKDRLIKAQALFAQRCQTAGEKIHRTVDNVEGIYLLKVRPQQINFGNQFSLDDPYGRDLGGDGYIESFVRGSYQANHAGTPIAGAPPVPPQVRQPANTAPPNQIPATLRLWRNASAG